MYLLVCSVVMLLAMYQWLRIFTQASVTSASDLLGFDTMIPASLMCAPVFATLFDELRLYGGQPLATSEGMISVALALLGALIVLTATVVDGIRYRTERNIGFFVRRLVLAASASLVLASATSHLMFARDAGTVTFEFFRDEVKDMHCDSGLVLFQWDRSPDSPVRYRCPRGYMLNRHSSLPFMPWPNYSEGYSADLAAALHEIMKDLPER